MKLTMALAVFLGFTVLAFGQGAVLPPQPGQSPQVQTKIIPQEQQPSIAVSPQGQVKIAPQQQPRAMVLPNWPSDKPAPVIQIPTEIPPQKAVLVTRPNAQAATTAPSSEK